MVLHSNHGYVQVFALASFPCKLWEGTFQKIYGIQKENSVIPDDLQFLAIATALADLPVTEPNLECHPNEARHTYSSRVAYSRRS
jgi:hypothetical protein